MPSCLKLVQASWKGKGWSSEDYETSLAILSEIAYEHFENPRVALARHPLTPQTVVDYRTLTREPRDTVIGVYGALGLPISDDYDHWLQVQAEREKKHHSKFEYSLGEFHLNPLAIRERLSVFYDEYNWDTETPAAKEVERA